MICPYCSRTMESGSIQSRGTIRWFSDKTLRIEWRPQASAKDGLTIASCGAGPFAYALEPAFYCPECQMVMIKKEDGD